MFFKVNRESKKQLLFDFRNRMDSGIASID